LGDAYGMTKRGRKIDFFKVAKNDMGSLVVTGDAA